MNKNLLVGAAVAVVFSLSGGAVFAAVINPGGGPGGSGIGVGPAAGAPVGVGVGGNASTSAGVQVGNGEGAMKGSLEAEVNAQALSNADADAIVNLDNESDALIESDADLEAYDHLVISKRPAIKAIAVNNGTVSVDYDQPAKFLGIFSAKLAATMDVKADGTTSVHLPWYSFLYAKDTTTVENAVSAEVRTEGGAATGVAAQTALQQEAHLVNAATTAISAQTSASVSASATTTGSAGY